MHKPKNEQPSKEDQKAPYGRDMGGAPLDPPIDVELEQQRQAWRDQMAAQEGKAGHVGAAQQGAGPTFYAVANVWPYGASVGQAKADLMRMLLTNVQLNIKPDADPSSIAERLMCIVDETYLKMVKRGWITEPPVEEKPAAE